VSNRVVNSTNTYNHPSTGVCDDDVVISKSISINAANREGPEGLLFPLFDAVNRRRAPERLLHEHFPDRMQTLFA
jgi:hypothetical protein